MLFRGTSLIRKHLPLGPYSKPMPKGLGWSWGEAWFLISEVPLYREGADDVSVSVLKGFNKYNNGEISLRCRRPPPPLESHIPAIPRHGHTVGP